MTLKKFSLIFVLFFSFALQHCAEQKDQKTNLNQLRKTIDEFYEAINSGNTDKRLEMFTDNAIIMPNNGEIIRFNNTVKENWKSYDEEWIFRIKDLERVELSISQNTAYTVNAYYYTFHQIGKEADWKKTKNVHIWIKQDDGSWKLHVDIWNSSPPAQK